VAPLWPRGHAVTVVHIHAHAVTTSVGTAYYVDELERRSRERATEAANRLSRAAFWLGVVNAVLALAAAVVAVAALVAG
jgi:CHASE3 domain sensor protein